MEKPANADYEIHELIARRWSPRAFDPRPIERPLLRTVLEAGRWAASCFNEQPWHFLVAPREDQAAFASMLDCLVPFNQDWAKDASVLLIAVARMHFTRNGNPNRHAWYDLGQAAAQMAVQATASGLILHQMAGFDADKARAVYEIPAGFEPATAIALGYAADIDSLPADVQERERAPRTRQPQSEYVLTGTWGRPLRDD